tara:strand:- start:1155 stop:1340 length:186 start_codon:yes stop_codon:yes gene_type:complete
MKNKIKILITRVIGFISSVIAKFFCYNENAHVIVIDNFSRVNIKNLKRISNLNYIDLCIDS